MGGRKRISFPGGSFWGCAVIQLGGGLLSLPQGLAPCDWSQAAPELGPEGPALGTPAPTLALQAAVVSPLQCPAPISSQSMRATRAFLPFPLSPDLTP